MQCPNCDNPIFNASNFYCNDCLIGIPNFSSQELLLQPSKLSRKASHHKPHYTTSHDIPAVTSHKASQTQKALDVRSSKSPLQPLTTSATEQSHRKHSRADIASSSASPYVKKPFICKKCNTNFSNASNLSKHNRTIHEKAIDYVCEECDEKFTENNSLKRHVRAVHLKLKPHKCNMCGSSFAEKHTLNTHIRSCQKRTNKQKLAEPSYQTPKPPPRSPNQSSKHPRYH